jgi:hypothetical protein
MVRENTEAIVSGSPFSGLISNPRGIASLWQFPLGDELVVARRDVRGLFILNGTARFLWEEFNRGAGQREMVQEVVARYGVPWELASRDVDSTLASWSNTLLSPAPGLGRPGARGSLTLRDFASRHPLVEINCVLNGCGFRVRLEPGDLVEEVTPRLAPVAVPCLPPEAPFVTFTLVNGDDRVFVFRDDVCIADEEKTSGARAILLQELIAECNSDRQTKAILHAGACGTASGCVILAGASHAGKSTLCAALMASGFQCYSEDSVLLDEQFIVSGMPFPLMLRESSWPVLKSRFASFMESTSIHHRWGCNVRFLPSSLPADSSPAVAPEALVFVDYQPDAATTLRPLTQFEALIALGHGGFWVEHAPDSIAGFLAWLGRIGRYKLTYSVIDEASQAIGGLLS